jgi:hypothetical protein
MYLPGWAKCFQGVCAVGSLHGAHPLTEIWNSFATAKLFNLSSLNPGHPINVDPMTRSSKSKSSSKSGGAGFKKWQALPMRCSYLDTEELLVRLLKFYRSEDDFELEVSATWKRFANTFAR